MSSEPRLICSVITSSSNRDLSDLFSEVMAIHRDVQFDLYVLRDSDLVGIKPSGSSQPPLSQGTRRVRDPRNITELMADPEYFEAIRNWVIERCRTPIQAKVPAQGTSFLDAIRNRIVGRRRTPIKVRVPALATYFPDITSLYDYRQERAIKALANSVRLALALVDAGISQAAIVELVCGTILDPCECDQCKLTDRIFISDRGTKLDLLLASLTEVVKRVCSHLDSVGKSLDTPFALGAELEPGESYVLNDLEAIKMFDAKLKEKVEQTPLLRNHIGLNLDIAHVRIVEPVITADHLKPYRDLIVHAHISDHPGMHTRDQIVGKWTNIERRSGGYAPFLKILQDRLREYRPGASLPFSGAVALELEGCNRIRWVLDSLNAMSQVVSTARSYALIAQSVAKTESN